MPEPEVQPEEEAAPSLADELTEKIANLNSLMDVRDLQAAIRNPDLSRKDKKRLKDALEARVDAINTERAERKAKLFEEFGKQIAAIETEEDRDQVSAAIEGAQVFSEEEESNLLEKVREKFAMVQKAAKETERKAAEQAKQTEPAPEEPKKETREERVTRLHDAVMVLINSATSIEDIRRLKKSATFNEFRYVTEDTSRAADFNQQRESIRTALYAKSAELNMPLYNEIMGEIQAATDESGVLAALEKVEMVRNDFPPSQRNEITQAAEARIEALKAAPEPQATPLPEVSVEPPTLEEPVTEPAHEPATEPVAEQPAEAVNATPLNDPVNPQEEADRAYLETFDPATADDARLEEIASRYTSGEMLELLEKALSKYEEYMVAAAEESMK